MLAAKSSGCREIECLLFRLSQRKSPWMGLAKYDTDRYVCKMNLLAANYEGIIRKYFYFRNRASEDYA